MALPSDCSQARGRFDLFLRLPAEVRLFIWEHACTEERIIPLLPDQGHLFPITHPTLAVPPVLHACSESRQVALKHYNLSFHPRLYTNIHQDHLMLHIFFPHQVIDFALYFRPESGFNWDAAPPRLAVLLDDISFYQCNRDAENDAYLNDPTWRGRLQLFSGDFTWSLTYHPIKLEEVTLLVLPPLTARPNCVAHRFDFVEGIQSFGDLDSFLMRELRDRVGGVFSYYRDLSNEWTSPTVRVRHAMCSPWPLDSSRATSWSTPIRERNSAEFYAGLKLGTEPVPRTLGTSIEYFPDDASGIASRGTRIRSIRRDLDALREPFCPDVGLGPHELWDQDRGTCGTGMLASGINYRAERQPLWMSEDEKTAKKEKLSKGKGPFQPLVNFDFESFLMEPEDNPDFDEPFQFSTKQEGEERAEEPNRPFGFSTDQEGEDEIEQSDPTVIETLIFNGLFYYGRWN